MPRFFAPPASAEDWVDRTPSNESIGFTAAVQGDGSVTRLTYTVPAGRRAHIGIVGLAMVTTVVAGAAAFARLNLNMTPNGAALEQILQIDVDANVLTANVSLAANMDTFLEPGDVLTIQSLAANAIAIIQMTGGIAVTEFDA